MLTLQYFQHKLGQVLFSQKRNTWSNSCYKFYSSSKVDSNKNAHLNEKHIFAIRQKTFFGSIRRLKMFVYILINVKSWTFSKSFITLGAPAHPIIYREGVKHHRLHHLNDKGLLSLDINLIDNENFKKWAIILSHILLLIRNCLSLRFARNLYKN